MKSSTKRIIPPPIDLSIPESNLWGTQSRTVLDKSATGGRYHYAYDSEYVLDSEGVTLSVPTAAEMPLRGTTLWPPSSTSEAMPTQSNPHTQMTSVSDRSFTSERDNPTLTPNGRRRSRSEVNMTCGYRRCYPSILSHVASPSSELSCLSGSRFPHTPSSSSQSFVPQSTATFVPGFKHKLKASTSTDALAVMGKRNKLWSSITHLTSNASAVLDLDGSNKTPIKGKVRRPGTSPVPVSSYMPSIDSECSDSGRAAGIDMWKHGKVSRPSTASSAKSSSSRSPLKLSKFEWPKQWRKRLSLLRLSSSPVSPASSHSSTPSTSSTHSSSSLNLPSTPLTPASGDRCIHPLVSLQESYSQDLLLTPNKRNRSTPNLKLPQLSKEDLGKVNAYFAPPPPMHAVEALNGFSRHRTTSSDPKAMKSMLPLPSGLPKSRSSFKSPPVMIQPSAHLERDTHNVSIALPLSPISSISWNDSEDDSGVIYLTVVEDDWNDESGEAGLRLVEIPR